MGSARINAVRQRIALWEKEEYDRRDLIYKTRPKQLHKRKDRKLKDEKVVPGHEGVSYIKGHYKDLKKGTKKHFGLDVTEENKNWQHGPGGKVEYSHRSPVMDRFYQELPKATSYRAYDMGDSLRQHDEEMAFVESGRKIQPRKPTRMDWRAIISAKSARIQTARQRLADIFDVVEGNSVKRIKGLPLFTKNSVRMSPKRYLDLASSSGLTPTSNTRTNTKKWMHNSGVISDLGGAGSGDTAATKHLPDRYYIIKDKEGNYTKDMYKYIDDDIQDGRYMVGVNEEDFIDADTKPTTYEGKPLTNWRATDTRNKILGTGEDLTGDYGPDPDREIFRGDEGDSVEYYKRLLRRGEGFSRPFFSYDDEGNIESHEGRHRARALMEEDYKDIPVTMMSDKKVPLSKIKGQRESLDRKRADLKVNEALTGNKITIPRKDKRYPILGRYSKSARIQMARERLGAIGKAKRIKLHKDSYGLENAMVKAIQEEYGDFTDMGTLSGSHFLTTDGAVIGSGGDDHRSLVEQAIQRHPDRKLRKMFKDPKMDRTDLMHEFMKQSGLVRINGSSRTNQGQGDMSFSTFHPLSSGQRRFLNSHIENSGMSIDNISFDDMSDDQSVGRQLGLRGEYEDDENAEYAKLRQRIAETGRPKQFNFKETLNKHWKLAAKDPRFKAFTHSSSFVGNVKYDQDEQSMQIILNGKTYDFCNVEERLFDSFSGAGSKGAFFNREIKSLHNCGAW